MKHLVFVINKKRKTIKREHLTEQHCDYAFDTDTPSDAVYKAWLEDDNKGYTATVVVTPEGRAYAFKAMRDTRALHVSSIPNIYVEET